MALLVARRVQNVNPCYFLFVNKVDQVLIRT